MKWFDRLVTRKPPMLWRPDQYRGQKHVLVQATQMNPGQASSAARSRQILAEWVEFFSTESTNITALDLVSRVPQVLLDSLAGQTQLEAVSLKWGPYKDVEALGSLRSLRSLALCGATSVEDIEVLQSLNKLHTLTLSQAHRLRNVDQLAALTTLRSLCYGNVYPGSDRSVVVHDLQWIRSLRELRELQLPGTRLLDPDVAPILDLPHLESLRLPLRRSYRKQVFELAKISRAFADVAAEYESYDDYRASAR